MEREGFVFICVASCLSIDLYVCRRPSRSESSAARVRRLQDLRRDATE